MSAEEAKTPPPLIPPPLISPPLPKAGPLNPTFRGAWRGIWLLTWRSRLAWRRLPVHFAILLAIPVVVYFSVSLNYPDLFGDPAKDARRLSDRFHHHKPRLTDDETGRLRDIFTEEYHRANSEWRSSQDGTKNEHPSVVDMVSAINSGFDGITNRAQPLLKTGQYEVLDSFVQGKRKEYTEQVRSPGWGRTPPFYWWLIEFYFFIVLPLACVSSCGALIRDEIHADTLGFLTTRPLSRARLLIVKYLAQTLWLQIMALIEILLLITAGELRGVPELGVLLALLVPVQFLAVFAWGALGAFMGLATPWYMAAAMTYGLVVEFGIGLIPTNINTLSLTRHLKSLLGRNVSLEKLFDWPLRGVPFSVGALVLAAGIFLGLAALLFTVREYNPTSEMQK